MISKETAEHYQWGEGCDGWHLVKTPGLSIIQEQMPPDTSEVRHYHQKAQQFFYILAGTVTLEIDGRREILKPHEGVLIPAETPHQIFNESSEMLEFIVVSQPPSHSDRIISEAEQN